MYLLFSAQMREWYLLRFHHFGRTKPSDLIKLTFPDTHAFKLMSQTFWLFLVIYMFYLFTWSFVFCLLLTKFHIMWPWLRMYTRYHYRNLLISVLHGQTVWWPWLQGGGFWKMKVKILFLCLVCVNIFLPALVFKVRRQRSKYQRPCLCSISCHSTVVSDQTDI